MDIKYNMNIDCKLMSNHIYLFDIQSEEGMLLQGLSVQVTPDLNIWSIEGHDKHGQELFKLKKFNFKLCMALGLKEIGTYDLYEPERSAVMECFKYILHNEQVTCTKNIYDDYGVNY